MSVRASGPEFASACPSCGSPVVYWCSTRCRNDAALRRLGARRGAIEVRVVEVFRQQSNDKLDTAEQRPARDEERRDARRILNARAPTPSLQQALRVVRNDPKTVGSLLSHLERRRLDGTLAAREWLPVRNAIRLIAGELPPGIERPQ
jgi:hypothetical protein